MRTNRAARLLVLTLAACLLLGGLALAGPSVGLAAARSLQQGDRGNDVKELQTYLSRAGYPTGAVTGYFGPATLRALKEFQKDHRLKVDGIAGPATMAAVAKAASGESSGKGSATTYTVKSGDALSLIAERFGVGLHALMEANHLRSADRIVIGQKLTIPTVATSGSSGKTASGSEGPSTAPASEPAAAPPDAADMKPAKPVIYQASRRLALTFDDGPDPDNTPRVLEVLARHKALATFFVVGEKLDKNRDLAKRLTAAGHAMENHGYQHVDLTRSSAAAIRQNIDKGAEAIKAVTGRRPAFFRPPVGAFNETVADAARQSDERMVLWSNIGQTNLPPDQLKQRLLAAAFDGAVLLLHDTDPAVPEVLDEVLTKLEKDGYRFVTVPQLFEE
ncbi:MAG: polysaccharide deacetylase family protein [Firmicutes bacterium]|nr:polysaccharide deacetylase family protein [Bacillota bacterium]